MFYKVGGWVECGFSFLFCQKYTFRLNTWTSLNQKQLIHLVKQLIKWWCFLFFPCPFVTLFFLKVNSVKVESVKIGRDRVRRVKVKSTTVKHTKVESENFENTKIKWKSKKYKCQNKKVMGTLLKRTIFSCKKEK